VATSEEELEAKRQNVADLRQQLADEIATRENNEFGLQNDIVAEQLDAEAARLQQELEAARNLTKMSLNRDSLVGTGNTGSAVDAMQQAVSVPETPDPFATSAKSGKSTDQ
jgi:regulator of replication initiation timing